MKSTTSIHDGSSLDCVSTVESKEAYASNTSNEDDLVHKEAGTRGSPDDFREGGLQGWLSIAGGTLVSFCTFGVVQSFGVYQDYYTRVTLNQNSPSEVSWIGSVQVFLLFALGLPANRLLENGYFHHCMIVGTVIYAISVFMLSLAQPHQYYQHFLAQGVGLGTGMGLMFLPCFTMTSHYFRQKRSLAMGIVVAGSSVGACLYPVILNNLFEHQSFAWGIRAVGILDVGLLLVANLIMKPRLAIRKVGNESTPPASFKEVIRDSQFVVFAIGTFFLYAALHSVDAQFLKYSITIMNASSIFGRILPNVVADFYGPLNILIASSGVCGALMFALFGATNVAGVAGFGIVYGFFSGGVVSLTTPAVASFITHADLSDLGIRIGALSFVLAFALLTGNPIAGALLTSEHHWQRPLIFAAVVAFAGTACYLFIWKSVSVRRNSKRI
ncbi:MFS general substrate transporter [Coprinopsis marcescibilis]|uniref:MFS general substrate transporter n=1 Tax=Coprinopsis marcescibilis TaxID=230819 RepID=A0A5C3KUC7_COPMA|nr:MFS general substrate transporter [Coprinopsis marcescibilis]